MRCCVIQSGLLLISAVCAVAQQRVSAPQPSPIEVVLRETKPLRFDRGERLPLYVWAAGNLTGDDAQVEGYLRALASRGMAAYASWKTDSLQSALHFAAIQKRLGLPVNINATDILYGIFNGSEATAHIDADGKPFFDLSSSPTRKLGCPFAIGERMAVIRRRVDTFARAYRQAGIDISFVFADWEIDGPIEWNDGWSAARRCVRCRKNIHGIDDFRRFQESYRAIRARIERECYSSVIRKYFPDALVGNYGVYPNDGWRYWYDYFEKEPSPDVPAKADQHAKYRPWTNEFSPAGFTFAMPVVYTWYRTWTWYDWASADYRWFYNMLLVSSNAAAHRAKPTPIITFVHYSTTSPPDHPDPAVKQFSEGAYRELLWHMLLRGHDTFFLWCPPSENAAEIRPLHEVWAAALEYKEFLEHGVPVTFAVPKEPGTVISALRLGDRLLVRRTDFAVHAGPAKIDVDGVSISVPAAPGKTQILHIPAASGRK